MMSAKVLVLVLVLAINKGYSLKCYKCSTHVEPDSACVDFSKNHDHVTTDDCSEGEVCSVYTTKTHGTGTSTITRMCSPKDICESFHGKEEHNKFVDCQTCSSDLCNSGIATSISLGVFATALALQFLIIV